MITTNANSEWTSVTSPELAAMILLKRVQKVTEVNASFVLHISRICAAAFTRASASSGRMALRRAATSCGFHTASTICDSITASCICIKPRSFARSAEAGTWATSRPNRSFVGPSDKVLEGIAPDSKSGEEMALRDSAQVACFDFFDRSLVNFAICNQALPHELAQASRLLRVVLVVVGRHSSSTGSPHGKSLLHSETVRCSLRLQISVAHG